MNNNNKDMQTGLVCNSGSHHEGFALCLTLSCVVFFAASAAATEGVVSLTKDELLERNLEEKNNKSAVYVDQLIDASVAEDLPPAQLASEMRAEEDSGNLRTLYLSTDARHIRDENQQQEIRYGFGMRAYYQTLGYGDITLLAKAGRYEGDHSDDKAGSQIEGGHFILQQDAFTVTEDWTMNNTLGVNQNFQNRLITSSSRVSLTPHSFQGVSSQIKSEATELRFMAGEKGTLSGVSEFEAEDEQVFGFGVAHHMNKQWTVGAQGWRVEGDRDDIVRQENEVSAFARFRSKQGKHKVKTQFLSAEGNNGIWLDGETRIGRFFHQWGAYKLDQDVQWMGEKLGSEGEGLHWRTAYSHPRYNTHSSLDWQENEGNRRLSGRQSLNYHWDRDTQLGGAVSYAWFDSVDKTGQQRYLSAYITRRFVNNHNNRFQISIKDAWDDEAGTDDGREYELDYSHQWLLAGVNDLGFQLTARHHSFERQDDNSLQSGISWRREFTDGNHLGANVNVALSESDSKTETMTTYRMFANHKLNQQWVIEGGVEYDYHHDEDDYETSVYATLSYRDSWGKALNRAARRSGSIRGVVFYDDNADGIKQPLEKAAPGIKVVLGAGGLAETSNNNGEFEFVQVSVGSHRPGVREESVPLPWELANSASKSIDVQIRQTQFVYLPLVRLDSQD